MVNVVTLGWGKTELFPEVPVDSVNNLSASSITRGADGRRAKGGGGAGLIEFGVVDYSVHLTKNYVIQYPFEPKSRRFVCLLQVVHTVDTLLL